MSVLEAPQLTSGTDSGTYGYLLKIWTSILGWQASRTVTHASTTAQLQLTSKDWLIRVDSTSGATTVVLPDAAKSLGRTLIMKKIDSSGNAATMAGNGSDKIDGVSTKSTSTQFAFIRVVSVGSGWDTI